MTWWEVGGECPIATPHDVHFIAGSGATRNDIVIWSLKDLQFELPRGGVGRVVVGRKDYNYICSKTALKSRN